MVGESGSGKSVLTKTFTGMLEDNGRIAQGSIDYRGQDLTALASNKEWEKIRGAKIATIFQDPMTSLDPINTIGSQITEVIVKHQGKTAKEAKEMAIDYMKKSEFQKLRNVLKNILSNIRVGCVNVLLLR